MAAEEEIKHAALEALDEGFSIYEVCFIPSKKETRIRVMLDKLTDRYGAPNIAECADYSRRLALKLDDIVQQGRLGEDYSLEVSSPGAERVLREPADWERFRELPMKISYERDDGEVLTTAVKFEKLDENLSSWSRYERSNQRSQKGNKGKKNGKADKDAGTQIHVELEKIKKVRLYLG